MRIILCIVVFFIILKLVKVLIKNNKTEINKISQNNINPYGDCEKNAKISKEVVNVFVEGAKQDRIFYSIQYPILKANPNIKKINFRKCVLDIQRQQYVFPIVKEEILHK